MRHLSPTDAVPVLRGDVVFSGRPTGAGAEVITVRPIGAGSGARVHGFELSLARMLDGKRTAQDVVNQAARLGLPLSVPALEGFIGFLEQHHLLARSDAEARSAVSPWSERTEWDPSVRLQYQAALKALRGGRPDDARRVLDRLLATAPRLDEARMLRSWIDSHPDASSEDGLTFGDAYREAQRNWMKGADDWSEHPLVTDESVKLERAELRSVRRSFAPVAVLLSLLAVALVGLLIPIPRVVSVPGLLQPVALQPVVAAAPATIETVHVTQGQQVKPGDRLVTFAAPSGETLVAQTEGTVADLSAAQGRQVVEGQVLMSIQDTRQLRMMARLDPSQAAEVRDGQTATIALGQRRAKTTINAVSGREIVTTLDNANGSMEPGRAVLDIDVGSSSFLQRMLR